MREYRPESCVWETTLACHLSCRHCGSRAGVARTRELDTGEALDLVDQLADLGTRELTLSGGELLLRPDWERIIERSRARGMTTLVVSSGWAITPEVADRFVHHGVGSVSVSLDGGRDVHDGLRPLRGAHAPPGPGPGTSFDRVLRSFETLRAAAVTVAAVTQISQANIEELPRIRDLLLRHGVGLWQIQLTSPMGRAAEAGGAGGLAIANLTPAGASRVHDFIRAVQVEGRIRCLAADCVGYFGPEEHLLRSAEGRGDRFWQGCQAGMRVVGITSDGGIKGCLSMPDDFLEGNVRDRPFRKIWDDPAAFAYNRRFAVGDLTGRCRDCEFGRLCRAGCHSFAAAATGSIGENPVCVRHG